jgi:hypothetical protein
MTATIDRGVWIAALLLVAATSFLGGLLAGQASPASGDTINQGFEEPAMLDRP